MAPVSAGLLVLVVSVCLSCTQALMPPSPTVSGNITCDNIITFYSDGIQHPGGPNNNTWERSDQVTIPAIRQVYAIKCQDLHVVAGIAASFSNGIVTDDTWKCTNRYERNWASAAFNDSHWPQAIKIGTYGTTGPWYDRPKVGVSGGNISWIWTKEWRGGDKLVYCRKVIQAAAVHGGWSSWGSWSDCIGPCDMAYRVKTRQCNNPAPSNGGRPCSGISQVKMPCNNSCTTMAPETTETPAVDGGWGNWSSWSQCIGPCYMAHQTSTRRCDNPAPSYGGRPCYGDSQQSRRCPNFCPTTTEASTTEETTPAPVHGGWSEWSGWTPCTGPCDQASTQTRVRTCNKPTPSNGGRPCVGYSLETRPCASCQVEESECSKCNLTNGVGYLPDPCNCSAYYQCKQVGSGWLMYHRVCAECTTWSQESLTCQHIEGCSGSDDSSSSSGVLVIGDTCTVDGQTYSVVHGQPHQYWWKIASGDHIMTCAHTTVFILEICGCDHDDNSEVVTDPPMPQATCLTFDEPGAANPWGFSLNNGVYVGKTGNVSVVSQGCIKNKCGKFDAQSYSYLQIYAYSNAFSSYGSFSVSLWERRNGGSYFQGLINNGDCANPGSVHVGVAGSQTVNGRVRTLSGQADVTQQGIVNEWNHIIMTYDLSTLTLYVNGVPTSSYTASGQLANSHCPMMIGVETTNGQPHYFNGLMDEICIYRTALTASQAQNLYDSEKPASHSPSPPYTY